MGPPRVVLPDDESGSRCGSGSPHAIEILGWNVASHEASVAAAHRDCTGVDGIADLPTAETDTSKRLAPDGSGGVSWATGGGGGSGPTIYAASLGSDWSIYPTPTSPTLVTGLSVTVAASASPRTVLVNVGLVGDPTWYRPSIRLDSSPVMGAQYTSAGPHQDNDGVSLAAIAGFPVTIPGDSATHTLDVSIEAQGSTLWSTVRAGSWISVIG